MKKLLNLLVVFLLIGSASAQKVTVNELVALMKKPNVVVVDCRSSADYAKTHIKGAVNIDCKKLSSTAPIEGILKSSSSLASMFGKKGINKSKTVVLYCKTGVRAGRMYWVLKYLGVKDVRMLDGQMGAWFAARKPITKAASAGKSTTFTPVLNKKLKVNKAYVKSKLAASGTIIVDTRKAEDYAKGHIGKAVNIPHESLLAGKKLKSNAAMQSIFNAKGVTKNKEVILYCKTSTTAGLTFFVLHGLLKYPNVKIYDGAWLEWKS